ncbi:DUF262 domain-containing protein [Leeuwenhoekiella sp. LLG6367-2.1]|uniref:DUF262 domain-containing protein n=1 Tax=Leeuwenhoekiella sp. LLG6367-2.1 TaxID=3160833 RepID=UPI0038648B07
MNDIKIEQPLLFDFDDETENESIDFRYVITSYGADYPVDSLMKRIQDKVIFIPPFQRQFVWSINEASKFIESLILGLPVPGIFLSKEKDTNRLLVVDGQQRLMSLYYFYKGYFQSTPFKLQNVQKDLLGRSYATLKTSDRLRLDDSIIHATVVRQDEPDDSESSVYQIFERLNSGGRALKPQEIRACIYYGEFNELLGELVKSQSWRAIFGKKPDIRLKEQELILRFFSLLYNRENYEKPLKGFLNAFMSEHQHLEKIPKEEFENTFKNTFDFIAITVGNKPFRIKRNLNLGAFDSISIGVAERLKSGKIKNKAEFVEKYRLLTENEEFISVVQGGTSDEKNVIARINMAIESFKNLD